MVGKRPTHLVVVKSKLPVRRQPAPVIEPGDCVDGGEVPLVLPIAREVASVLRETKVFPKDWWETR